MFACVMIRASREAPQSYATAQTLLDALTPYDQDDVQGVWTNERMLMVQALTWNTPESRHENTPETCKDTGRVIVSWCRLDNRSALCAQLGLSDHQTLTDPQIILESHRKWGADCADKLEGDFSFIIYDPNKDQTFCARDSIGAKPFFYYLDKDVFIAASTAAIYKSLKKNSITPSRDWMVRFLMSLPHVVTESAYEEIKRLAPAHSLTVPRSGPAEPLEYFAFKDTAPSADTRDSKYVELYRDAFHNAVETRLRSDYCIGAENSGGLDSVSIMGHAVKHLPHDIENFHCFGLPTEKRTQELILDASIFANVAHTHLATNLTAFGTVENFDRAVQTLGHPIEHTLVNMHMPALHQSKSQGIRTMLSGYGGDEIVTNQANALNTELFKNGQFQTLKNEMRGNSLTRRMRLLKQIPALKTNKTYIDNFASIWDRAQKLSVVRQDQLVDSGLEADYKSQIAHAASATTLNDRILRNIAFTQCRVGRLEACTIMAQSCQIDYRWPLYDRQLIQCYLQTPAIEKRHISMGRYLHRRAISGSIPTDIAWQQSKDMGDIIWQMITPDAPNLLAEINISPHLSQLLDFEKLNNAHAAVQCAKDKNQYGTDDFMRERPLWAAAKLARWLDC